MEAVTDLQASRAHRASYEAQQDVIATCVTEPERLNACQLEARHFTEGPNRKLWEVMLALFAEGEPIDTVTVMERLEEQGDAEIGGYLVTLLSEHNPANFEHKARKVLEFAERGAFWRELETAFRKRDEAEVVRLGEQIQLRLAHGARRPTLAPIATAFQSLLDQWAEEKHCAKTTWGIECLDRWLKPPKPTRLLVVGARPRMGKTAMAVQMAVENAKQGHTVGIISLEQSMEELTARVLCNLSNAPMEWVSGEDKPPAPDVRRIDEAKRQLAELPIMICDQAPLTIGQIHGWARTLVQRYSVDLLIIDYIQKIKIPRGQDRRDGVADAVIGLKDIAKIHKIPVIALAQANRDAEGRRPTMADIKDSGVIEQEADQIVFLHREKNPPGHEHENELSRVCELIIAKNRHGRGDLLMESVYRGEVFRFEKIAPGAD